MSVMIIDVTTLSLMVGGCISACICSCVHPASLRVRACPHLLVGDAGLQLLSRAPQQVVEGAV